MTTSRLLTGLSAFPLTPIADDTVDERAFARIVERLATGDVDSITALGSTGSYAYLDRDERRRAVELAVAAAGEVPVLAGIGHVRTREVLLHADDAQAAGAAALLLAPVTYQALTDDEVFQLFRRRRRGGLGARRRLRQPRHHARGLQRRAARADQPAAARRSDQDPAGHRGSGRGEGPGGLPSLGHRARGEDRHQR